MQARWLPSTGNESPVVEESKAPKGWIRARIERYALSNGAPLYFVRAEASGLGERTLSLKFDNFRSLHRRLAEEGGVLYGAASFFPKAPRKARLGLRMTTTEISEQCDALNTWLRETTQSVAELPLASQREVRIFLALEGAEPPPWTTAKSGATASGLFSSMSASASKRRASATKKKEESPVYPLGESASLPGVTRRGRLECRDANTGQWLSVHVILTHLSLLVFQPVATDSGLTETNKAVAKNGETIDANSFKKEERGLSVDRTAAESVAAAAGSANAHPLAAALAEGVGTANKDVDHDTNKALPLDESTTDGISVDAMNNQQRAPTTPRTTTGSAGRLLHNLHVTDILSLLRHGDTDALSAPPIHHRCFTIGDLNDTSVCLRAVSARDCIQWLKAVARAKDRALAAVHRLDDKSHGHELVLATLVRPGKYAGRDESIVARGYQNKGQLYGWFEPLRVRLMRAQLRFELNAGELEIPVTAILERAASDLLNGLGPASSQHAAEAAANSGALSAGAFWARVKPHLDDDLDLESQRLEVLLAVDASRVLADALAFQAKRRRSGGTAIVRRFRSLAIAVRTFATDQLLPALKQALGTRIGAVAVAAFTCFLVSSKNNKKTLHQTSTLQDRIVLEKSSMQSMTGSALLQSQLLFAMLDQDASFIFVLGPWKILQCFYIMAFVSLVVFVSYAEPVDNTVFEKPAATPAVTLVHDAIEAANEESAIDVRLVNWRWRDADRELRDAASRPPVLKGRLAPKKAPPAETAPVTALGKMAQRIQFGVKSFFPGSVEAETTDVAVDTTTHLEKEAEEDAVQPTTPEEEIKPPTEVEDEEEPLPTDVPARFLGAVRGDHAAAIKRWSETVAFREAGNRPDEVLQRPQPYFHRIKAKHKHFVHKRDRLGHILAFEVVDTPNRSFKQLNSEGVTVEDVANHMHFVSAFTYVKILDDVDEVGRKPKDPEGYFLKVIDLRHIGLGDCGGDTARYFKLVAAINRNYPERVWRTIIINAPSVFGVIWTIVSPLLEPNVREKITVLRSNYKEHLRELVDPDDLPVEYGGNDAEPSPEEVALATYVDELNARAGITTDSPKTSLEDEKAPAPFANAILSPTDASDRGDDSPRTVATDDHSDDNTQRKSMEDFINSTDDTS